MNENATLSSEEKTFVAMAAAMGGGCRTCAERLFAVGQSLDMDVEDMRRAFDEGLAVRDAASALMRDKARSLHGRETEVGDTSAPDQGDAVRELARLAAAVAANAAPVALGYAQAARAAGAGEAAIRVAIGIGRTIRGKAQSFSDEELGDAGEVEEGSGTSAAETGQRSGTCGPGMGCACGEAPRRTTASGCC